MSAPASIPASVHETLTPQTMPVGPPLRITFLLARADLSGGCRVIRTYAECLTARGHSVQIVSCPEPKQKLLSRLKRVFMGEGLRGRPRTVPNHFDGSSLVHKVTRRHREVSPDELPDADVLVATWWETAEWAASMPSSKGSPLFFVQHDERVFTRMDPERQRRVESTWRLDMPSVVVAEWIGEEMRQHGADPSLITLVPNAVDVERFRAEPRGKQPVPTVGLMFAWVNFKGVDIVLEAIRIARQTLPDLKIRCFGHADLKDSPLELPPNLEYQRQPPQDEIRDIYAGCDAWLFGSRCEGFGLPILEAMACRTPVIGTPAGAAPELLSARDGEEPAGILVPMEDSAAMAEAIVKVARMSEGDWRELSDRAHRVATGYSWEQACDLFEEQIREAAVR